MKKLLFVLLAALVISGCDEDGNPIDEILNNNITAKEKLPEVLTEARADFAADAQLAMIYGRDVSTNGTIDLLDFSTLKAFVYVVQSDETETNEFYVPVYGAGPVQSPINFSTMLSLIEDPESKERTEGVLGLLSQLSINSSATYPDSDDAMDILLANGGSDFMSSHSGAKIDLFLVPSKSIDTTGLRDSADWLANFYTSTESLVLWYNTGTGIVTQFR